MLTAGVKTRIFRARSLRTLSTTRNHRALRRAPPVRWWRLGGMYMAGQGIPEGDGRPSGCICDTHMMRQLQVLTEARGTLPGDSTGATPRGRGLKLEAMSSAS